MRPFKISNLTLGGILRIFGVVVLLGLVLLYVQFQARNFIQGPSISLLGDYESVQYSQELELEGSVENIVKLTLNGREINTDEQGNFKEDVFLEKGYTVLTLYAEDRFGRSTRIEREYVYVENE